MPTVRERVLLLSVGRLLKSVVVSYILCDITCVCVVTSTFTVVQRQATGPAGRQRGNVNTAASLIVNCNNCQSIVFWSFPSRPHVATDIQYLGKQRSGNERLGCSSRLARQQQQQQQRVPPGDRCCCSTSYQLPTIIVANRRNASTIRINLF